MLPQAHQITGLTTVTQPEGRWQAPTGNPSDPFNTTSTSFHRQTFGPASSAFPQRGSSSIPVPYPSPSITDPAASRVSHTRPVERYTQMQGTPVAASAWLSSSAGEGGRTPALPQTILGLQASMTQRLDRIGTGLQEAVHRLSYRDDRGLSPDNVSVSTAGETWTLR